MQFLGYGPPQGPPNRQSFTAKCISSRKELTEDLKQNTHAYYTASTVS
jgi:hypothetical protein